MTWQHRVFMEVAWAAFEHASPWDPTLMTWQVAWAAFEHAGYAPRSGTPAKTAVFASSGENWNGRAVNAKRLESGSFAGPPRSLLWLMTGTAGVLAYCLLCAGPPDTMMATPPPLCMGF